ncbi:MAG: hypothetical protein RLZZ584_3227 [Pseudomonadota bacterium]|jgi:hypothetical protein
MRTISLRLDDDHDALLSAYCRRHGLTQTEAIKSAIAGLVADNSINAPTPAELAAELGLIVTVAGAGRAPGQIVAEAARSSAAPATAQAAADVATDHARQIKQRLLDRRARDEMPAPPVTR